MPKRSANDALAAVVPAPKQVDSGIRSRSGRTVKPRVRLLCWWLALLLPPRAASHTAASPTSDLAWSLSACWNPPCRNPHRRCGMTARWRPHWRR